MNIEDIIAELRAGDEALAASELLSGANLCRDAISRAYYAVLHYVRVLLLVVNVIPQSHHGAFVLFGREFIKTGEIPSDFNRIMIRLMKLREEADYTSHSWFSKENVDEILENVRAFRKKAIEILVDRNIPVE